MNNLKKVDDQNKKVVLLTGASTGLGLALAKQLIQDDKYKLVLTSRSSSQQRFKENYIYDGNDILIRELNIINYNQVNQVINEINEKLGGVDILINNAGISESSCVEDTVDFNRQLQLDINYLAPFQIITTVLKNMRQKKWGKIINISSASGFMGMPTMSSYSASKFALEGASESLWYEVKPWNISVTLIIPGFIHSFGYQNTKKTAKSFLSQTDHQSSYFEHYKNMSNLISKNMSRTKYTNELIAKQISDVLNSSHPPLRIYATLDAWLFYWLRKICPPNIYLHIMYRFLPNISKWGKQN